MTGLIREKFFEDLGELNNWFSEVRETLELSSNADRGRVLANLQKLMHEIHEAKREQSVVAKAHGYRFWGDCYNAAVKTLTI